MRISLILLLIAGLCACDQSPPEKPKPAPDKTAETPAKKTPEPEKVDWTKVPEAELATVTIDVDGMT